MHGNYNPWRLIIKSSGGGLVKLATSGYALFANAQSQSLFFALPFPVYIARFFGVLSVLLRLLV